MVRLLFTLLLLWINYSNTICVSLSDSVVFEKLSKRISELEVRIEEFEKSLPPAAIPSIASLTRKASKTPAHDIVDILSVKGKLEASESTIESLAELVDSLVTDVNVMKQVIPNITDIPNIVNEMEKLNTVLEDLRRSVDNRLKTLETRCVDDSDTKPGNLAVFNQVFKGDPSQ